ncbi:2TM domain-containing protein [Flavobacterium sp. SM15]|uniref:2TM domain-containing protein n=1 Tax=Flavobacterium sp. SM15 TaxID=2908005 RepID=UPI001EDBBA19|nr:2TM domain-containing protein [Flavobacterium sp. SM15]MCG2611051.1 2TM domain-containing protein [Flavobacterium sp. SM15]
MESTNNNFDQRYQAAEKRVKRLKGFYSHLLAYVIVNIMIVCLNIRDLKPGESYFQFQNFFTAFFWGIGLLAHGVSVFGHHLIFGKNWEERKIKEFMGKEHEQQGKWE